MSSLNLVIVCGKKSYRLDPPEEKVQLYRIGPGTLSGTAFIDLNDNTRLCEIANEIRSEYTRWVSLLSRNYKKENVSVAGLPLFFLTDSSCKRSEFFQTFGIICNCIYLQRILVDKEIQKITILGGNTRTVAAIRSCFPSKLITSAHEQRGKGRLREHFSNSQFLLTIATIGVLNIFIRKRKELVRTGGRWFFTIFPKMLTTDYIDKKYCEAVDNMSRYLVTISTDGFHQKPKFWMYLKWLQLEKKRSSELIDKYIRAQDAFSGLYWLICCERFNAKLRNRVFHYENIDITLFIRDEIAVSGNRLFRLLAFRHALKRVLFTVRPDELIYYLHEYPIGRLISWTAEIACPDAKRVGFQHGPSSWRKLLYFISEEEVKGGHASLPRPHSVIAEDCDSKEIYEYSGYQNVTVMENVSRISYLNTFQPSRNNNYQLIAPGLHDGEEMLIFLQDWIDSNQETRFLFKPHPLARRQYLDGADFSGNLEIVDKPIPMLFPLVDTVFVTYSSVGLEGLRLRLKIRLVTIPGTLNETNLMGKGGELVPGVEHFTY